jgi:hypothetical protein
MTNRKIVEVEVKQPDYGVVELNVDKIIAVSVYNSEIFFENIVWKLSDKEFQKVYQLWKNNEQLND